MKTIEKKLYEGMFLVDSLEAVSDWEGITGLIKNILQRADAEIVTLKKWDDRKLMYDIGDKNRGTYILCYFKAPGPRVTEIEHDIQLSERIMRALILSAEAMSQADITRETPLEVAERLGGRPAVEAPAAPAEAAAAIEQEIAVPEEIEAQEDTGQVKEEGETKK